MVTAQRLLERSLAAFRSRVAVVDGEREVTYGQLEERSARLGSALVALGASAERPVAILLPNGYEYIEADVACARAAVTRVGINERLSPAECQYLLQHSQAAVLITAPGFLERFDASTLQALRTVIAVGEPVRGGLAYEDALARARPRLDAPASSPTDPAYLLYTSGTTGFPKGATHTQGSRVASTLNMLASELHLSRDSGMLHVGPLTHGSGSKVIAFLALGARNVVLPRFHPEAFRAVPHLGVTHTFLVPTMIQRLLEAGPEVHDGVRALRQVSFGGSAIAPSLFEQAIEVFGPILTQVYGSAEAPHPVTVLTPEDCRDARQRERALRSAGRVALGVEAQVVDDGGEEVAPGAVGELVVRGPNVMTGYWNDPSATPAAFTVDGWYRSGDLVTIDEDGLMTVMDRNRDLIISGGFNVYPAEVERVLSEHPLIQECAVVGAPDPEWGEAVVAWVVAARPQTLTEAQVIDWLRGRLAGYKKPKRVIFVDSLPLGSSLKVLKHQLREELWAGRERRV